MSNHGGRRNLTPSQCAQRRVDSEHEATCRQIDYWNRVIRPPGTDPKPYPERKIVTYAGNTLLDSQRRRAEEDARVQMRVHQIHNVTENRRGNLDRVTMLSENGGSPARDQRGFFARDTPAAQRDPGRLAVAIAALTGVGHSPEDAQRIALRADPTAADDHRAGHVNTGLGTAQLRWNDLVVQETQRRIAAAAARGERLDYIVAFRAAGADLSAQRPDLYREYRADCTDLDDIGG
jgi:hypothetical protein